MLGHTARHFRVDWVVIACSLTLVLAACGGGGDTADTTTRTAATAAPGGATGETTGGTESTEDFEPQTFVVEHAVWHSGFRIDVLEGELSRVENALSREERFLLTLEVSYENLGPHDTFFDGQMALVADGNSFVSPNFGGDSVPSGLSSRAEVTFQVEEGFDVLSQMAVHHRRNLGREHDLEAALRDVPAHHALGVGEEHGSPAENPQRRRAIVRTNLP